MRRTEVVFLVCVFGFAAAFTARSLSQAVWVLGGGAGGEPTTFGVAGKPREVDMERLLELIDRGALSHHEAQFYGPASSAVRAGPAAVPAGPVDQSSSSASGSLPNEPGSR